jgi:predicted MFS family arabinose efflux permease
LIGRARAYLRSIDPRLPRAVWTLEAGGLVNAFGNGITFPFVVIYLHNVRGFSLGIAGLALATNGIFSLLASPVAGWLSDRIGGRLTLAGALVTMAAGIGYLPFVREPWQAFFAMAVVGWGNGSFWPSQSTLLAGLAPPARRHAAYALQRVSRNLGIGLGGLTGGLIATTSNPTTFTFLFAIDAASFLAFVVVLAFVPDPELPPVEEGERPGRYRDVLRDRLLLGIVGLNILFVSAGYAQIELLPAFAKNEAGVTEKAIGAIFLVNTLVIVLAQLPIAHQLEGRRRMPALALMTVLWASAWMIVLVCGATLEAVAAAVGFALAGVVFGLGECFQGPTQGALVADLAPPRLRGRYMALSTISWETGFVIGPAVGGFVLDHRPLALWPLAAGVCLLAGVGALALERGIPRELRLTPA